MFFLSKEFPFEASHQLTDHDGKCARLHGHSWKMTVTIAGDRLHPLRSDMSDPSEMGGNPKTGMLMDYSDLKGLVQPFVDLYLDHNHLNESLNMRAPTSEAIAKEMFEKIRDRLSREKFIEVPVMLVSVKIDETCTSSCLYVPDPINWSSMKDVLDNLDRVKKENDAQNI